MPLGHKLVVGNWKMHGSRAVGRQLLPALVAGVPEGVEAAVCVPFPYLTQAGRLLEGSAVGLGAQDVSEHVEGAYTGEVSAAMLVDLGCRYVIVGHSERRSHHGESDALIGRKLAAALKVGLLPILCCGESLAEHQAGNAEAVVDAQLAGALAAAALAEGQSVLVAYEPVWAIGTGLVATPEHVEHMHARILARLPGGSRVLYGGSVKPDNAAALFACPSVNGALVGGASLNARDFLAICNAARDSVA